MKSSVCRIVHVVSVLVVAMCAASQAAVFYVSPEGDNTTGQDWVTALNSIQTALDRASPLGRDTIKVRKGTYAINAPILVGKPVYLNGGYSGEGDARNAAVNVTVVQGGDTAIHCFNVSADATIDGFWITGGLAFGSAPNNQGGGMFIDRCDPVIYNCTFQDNYAELVGGAIAARFSGGSISHCAFVANVTGQYGAAICMFSSSLDIMDCQFTGNKFDKTTTTSGGGIYSEDSTPTISGCIFSGNAASLGSGIYNANSDAEILDCDFAGCDLASGRGGGVYSYQSAPTIKDCLFHGNQVSVSGGAIYDAEGSSSTVIDCILRNNSATALGGGIYIDSGATTTFTNCTIYANVAGSRGGAVYNYYGKPIFTNCIIWGNSASMGGPGICNESDSPSMMAVARYSDVQGAGVYPGTGNIVVDPQFVYPAGDDLHLTAGSPCIDAGTNDISTLPIEDYEQNPRVVDGNVDGKAVVDMGAYEHQLGLRIMDHLGWVHIAQGKLYAEPLDVTPGYLFVAEMQTDNSVDHIEFLAPGGYAYTIPNNPSTTAPSGDIHTSHEVSGSVNVWRYWGRFDDAQALSRYGDGGYLVILYYKDGSTQQSNFSYRLPGKSDPIPLPVQRPHIVAPAQQAGVSSPVTIQWDSRTDTAVTNIVLVISDPQTGANFAADNIEPNATSSNPYDLAEGVYQVELGFESSYYVNNSDGVPFKYGKSVVMRGEFEVLNATVYRFWSPATNFHFYTISEAERTTLIDTYSYAWNYEGPAFKACVTAYHPGLSPVYRFWSPYSSTHFYTITESEKDMLIRDYSYWWNYEGIAYYAYADGDEPAGTTPVYRFWSPVLSSHFYTTSADEKNFLIRDWPTVYTYEGVAFYAYP